MSGLSYLKRWKTVTKMSVAATTDYTGGGTKTVSMFRFVNSRLTEFLPEGGKDPLDHLQITQP